MANQASSMFQDFTTHNLKEYIRLSAKDLASGAWASDPLSYEEQRALLTAACEECARRSRSSWWYPIARLFA